jgi:hypothetical protein
MVRIEMVRIRYSLLDVFFLCFALHTMLPARNLDQSRADLLEMKMSMARSALITLATVAGIVTMEVVSEKTVSAPHSWRVSH